eukprot:g3572.t1
MTRSNEAIQRRAEKRGRSVQEQLAADRPNVRNAFKKRRHGGSENKHRISEGANDAKRAAHRRSMPKLVWPEQAGPERVEYNMQLRKRYKEDRSSLSAEQLERAEQLMKRDRKKKEKRLQKEQQRLERQQMKQLRLEAKSRRRNDQEQTLKKRNDDLVRLFPVSPASQQTKSESNKMMHPPAHALPARSTDELSATEKK